MTAQDPIARLVDELMLVSVVVAGQGEAALAGALEQAGANATVLTGPATDTYDLAILLSPPESANAADTRTLVTALSAASERLLLLPVPIGGGEPAPGSVLPELPQWFELLAEFGYQPVVEFDAGFLSPGSFLVDRAAIAAEGDLAAFAERLQSGPAAQPGLVPADGPASVLQDPPSRAHEHETELAGLRTALASSQAEAAARAAEASALFAQLHASQAALAQAQGQEVGWERLRDWVRALVADPARNTPHALARDLPRLNALRGEAPPIALSPTRRRWWRRHAEPPTGLLADAALVRASPLFDAAWYAASIPELAQAPALDPVFHYLLVGAGAGADPGPWFDSAAYLAAHPEAAGHPSAPLVHAIRTGAAQAPESE